MCVPSAPVRRLAWHGWEPDSGWVTCSPMWAIGMGRVCVPSSEALTQPLTPKPGGGPEIDAVVDRKGLPCPGLQHQEDMVSDMVS